MVMFSKNWLSSLFSMIENGSVVVTHSRLRCRQCRKMTHAQCEGLLSPKGLPSCSDRELCFVKKMELTWESMGEVWGDFHFAPNRPRRGRGHLKHDFRLTERLLPDSTMTYRGRSDGLVVESDRKKITTFKFTCHLRDLQGYCVYTSTSEERRGGT